MLTLLSECHFWTTRDEIRIKSTDFGSYRYSRSRDFDEKSITAAGKREYAEKRDGKVLLKNQKNLRLKENLKKFEDLLKQHQIVHSEWKDAAVAQILFSNGMLAYICVDVFTGDVLKMAYDKYLVGKLAGDVITDAIFTRHHILLAYNTNQITVVYLQKPNTRRSGPEKTANMDPKIIHVLIPGPSERKLARNLVVNNGFDLIVVWTKSSQNEVYPWRPTVRDQDRANIHIFKLKSAKLESIGYCWTENDPLCVEFLRSSENQILTIEQRVSRKGEITAEISSYEFTQTKMQRTSMTSISLGTQICCHKFSPDQEKLFIGTIDRYICVHDLVRQSTKFAAQVDIIPTQCAWHPDSGLVFISNDRSQFQCFDIGLSPVANQLISEDVTPSNLLDLSHYFTVQPNLLNISFSCKPALGNFTEKFAQTDCFLLIVFENGPIGCLRFFAGTGLSGDIHNSGLTPDVLVNKYLLLNQFEKAVNLMLGINWETYGAMCLISLHKMCNHIFARNDQKRNRIELLAKALRTFTEELSDETKYEFSDQVFDLKRRFFFFLLRNKLYIEAFETAQNIEDYDLFMDLFNITKNTPRLQEFSQSSYVQAEHILNDNEPMPLGELNSISSCSQSTCSDSIPPVKHETNADINGSRPPTVRYESNAENKLKNYVPPLPSFKSPIFSAENIKINIPKPELRMESHASTLRVNRSQHVPPLPELKYRQIPTHYTKNPRPPPIEAESPRNAVPLRARPSQQWSPIPDQTLGIPTIPATYQPFIPLLPRASTSTIYNAVATPAVPTYELPEAHFTPKFYQHPLISGTIPPTATITTHNDIVNRLKKPTASILSNSSSMNVDGQNGNSTNPLHGSTGPLVKKDPGEKNKVKFSDTVQVAVVPEIPRKEKPQLPKRNGYTTRPRSFTNPKKELADSLPLCHPHDEYLKDFNPVSESANKTVSSIKEEHSNSNQSKNAPSIKVVHFGVV